MLPCCAQTFASLSRGSGGQASAQVLTPAPWAPCGRNVALCTSTLLSICWGTIQDPLSGEVQAGGTHREGLLCPTALDSPQPPKKRSKTFVLVVKYTECRVYVGPPFGGALCHRGHSCGGAASPLSSPGIHIPKLKLQTSIFKTFSFNRFQLKIHVVS